MSQPLYKQTEHDSLMYLWRQRTLYVGPPHKPRYRCYHSDCLLIGFEETLIIKTPKCDEIINSQIALIPANTKFHMEVKGNNFAMIFLDYLGLDLLKTKEFALKEQNQIYYQFEDTIQQHLIQTVTRIYQSAPIIEDVADSIFNTLGFDKTLDSYDINSYPESPDPRLWKIINMYLNGQLNLDAPIADAAKAVNLSVSRVNQLFRKHLNISFRVLRNRLRIHLYFLARAFGKTNTQSALEAGFVDQAHFCHRFKESAGIKISVYTGKKVTCNIIVEREMAKRYQENQPIYGTVKLSSKVE